MDESKKLRLQKFLAQAGIASRREGERLILGGHVSVNGKVVTQLGTTVDPEKDRVAFQGKLIQNAEKKVYYLFHKPKNVMVTRSDPEGRPTVYDYLKNIKERVNYVGRLDFDSEGLIFLTNDGELHHRMTHPSKEIPKVYRVRISVPDRRVLPAGSPSSCVTNGLKGQTSRHPPYIEKLSSGVDIGGYVTAPCRVKIIDEDWLEMTITEGKNRQIRRMCEAVGLEVSRLVRVAIGSLTLEGLKPGQFRPLTFAELKKLTEMFRDTGRGTTGGL